LKHKSSKKIDIKKLNPKFSHRFSTNDIFNHYGNAQAAFDAGDYALVANYSEPKSEIKGSALILCGLIEQGLKTLTQLHELSPFGYLCLAFALWSKDRHSEALTTLFKIRTSPNPSCYKIAQSLARLIETPDINIITISLITPIFTTEADNTRSPVIRYGQFVSKQVTNQLETNAYDYDFSDPFDKFLKSLPKHETPTFIYSMSPQTILPLHYDRIKIPKIMACHDTDIFLYRGHDNFRLNDLNIVATSQEHFEISRGLNTPVVTNLLCCAMTPTLPRQPKTDKEIDILFTGSSVTSIHSEKSRFLYQILKLSNEFNIQIFDGHLPENEYLDLLDRSNFTPIINRYAGTPSPRWCESLLSGSHLLYPENTLFGEVTSGTFSFRSNDLENDFRRHLKAFKDTKNVSGSPYNTAETFPTIKNELSFLKISREKKVERQLRFCIFSMLVQQRKNIRAEQQPHQRLSWYVPGVDARLWGRDHVQNTTLSIADKLNKDRFSDDIEFNNAALIYIQILHALNPDSKTIEHCLKRSSEIIEQGLKRFPNSLLLRFNKTHWAFMLCVRNSTPFPSYLKKDLEFLIRDFQQLEFNPLGSDVGIGYTVMHYDRVFPYYDYGQLIVKYCVRKNTPDFKPKEQLTEPREVILGAIYGYLAWEILLSKKQIDVSLMKSTLIHFNTSFSLYEDNLPLKHLLFDSLATCYQCFHDQSLVPELINAFYSYAEKYPTALALDMHRVLPAIEKMKDEKSMRYLINEWATFSKAISFLGKDKYNRFETIGVIMKYYRYFPDWLKKRIEQLRTMKSIPIDINQFDDTLFKFLQNQPNIS